MDEVQQDLSGFMPILFVSEVSLISFRYESELHNKSDWINDWVDLCIIVIGDRNCCGNLNVYLDEQLSGRICMERWSFHRVQYSSYLDDIWIDFSVWKW